MTTEEATNVRLPILVECTDVQCDRDPKHLEKFVADFYKWLIAEDIKRSNYISDISKNKTPPEIAERQANYDSIGNSRFLRHALTPDFYHWTTIYTADPPPPHDPRYCPEGTNALFCTQAHNEDQFASASLATNAMTDTTADIDIALPALGRFAKAYNLQVRLLVQNGAWLIDGITRPDIGESLRELEPPKLVRYTSSNCAQNPQALEEFIRHFYEWRTQLRTKSFELRRKSSAEANKEIMYKYAKLEAAFIRNALTPDFLRLYERVMRGRDGQNNAPNCLDTDADPLLCTIEYPDYWLGDIAVERVSMQNNFCEFKVSLPDANVSEKQYPKYQLFLRMKPIKKFWRIDWVTNSSPTRQNGK